MVISVEIASFEDPKIGKFSLWGWRRNSLAQQRLRPRTSY
jgi:hypothetical protein